MPVTTTSRLTGLAYLGIVATGVFAEFAVRGALVVPGDPAATAARIAGSPGLFGAGVAADGVMVALDVVVGVGLFRLLRPHGARLAAAAMGFRLVQALMLIVNLRHLIHAAELARRVVHGGPVSGGSALQAMNAHALGYDAALIAFGVSCLLLGRLLRRSRAVPWLLALGLSATGVVYLVGSFAALFAPTLSPSIDPFYLIALLVEPAFAAWLLLRGVARPNLSSERGFNRRPGRLTAA